MTASAQQQKIAVAEFYCDLGRRIAEARTDAGLSQDELGARMGGLTRSGVSNVEIGRSAVLAHNVVRYAAVLGVGPLWLLTGDSSATEGVETLAGPLRAAQ